MKNALSLLLRLGLAIVLVWAGVAKWRDATAFAIDVSNYRLFPALAPYVAIMLPMCEIVVGLALIVIPSRNRWARAAALASALLMAMLTFAVAQVVARGINVSCGCFGGNSGPVTSLTVVRDLALLSGALLLLALLPRPSAKSPH